MLRWWPCGWNGAWLRVKVNFNIVTKDGEFWRRLDGRGEGGGEGSLPGAIVLAKWS